MGPKAGTRPGARDRKRRDPVAQPYYTTKLVQCTEKPRPHGGGDVRHARYCPSFRPWHHVKTLQRELDFQ